MAFGFRKSSASTSESADSTLTPFESLMWLDDRRGYPMTCYVELMFRGELHIDALQAAARQALERHPRLRSRVLSCRDGLQWILDPCAQADLVVQRSSTDYPPGFWDGMDLRREHGLRLVALPERETSRLLMQFHHACCDGVGALV